MTLLVDICQFLTPYLTHTLPPYLPTHTILTYTLPHTHTILTYTLPHTHTILTCKQSMNDEELVMRKRLTVEGEGGGDDRRIMSLIKTFVR